MAAGAPAPPDANFPLDISASWVRCRWPVLLHHNFLVYQLNTKVKRNTDPARRAAKVGAVAPPKFPAASPNFSAAPPIAQPKQSVRKAESGLEANMWE